MKVARSCGLWLALVRCVCLLCLCVVLLSCMCWDSASCALFLVGVLLPWFDEGKLECSEDLGDLVKQVPQGWPGLCDAFDLFQLADFDQCLYVCMSVSVSVCVCVRTGRRDASAQDVQQGQRLRQGAPSHPTNPHTLSRPSTLDLEIDPIPHPKKAKEGDMGTDASGVCGGSGDRVLRGDATVRQDPHLRPARGVQPGVDRYALERERRAHTSHAACQECKPYSHARNAVM
eukprot:2886704-Rhodomonas_salina.1